jgi:aminoglycoside phosphotransferase (APT) family kinase protein
MRTQDDPESRPKLHPNELAIDSELVRRLLEHQFPEWLELPIRAVKSSGTVHAIYRLGDELSVRLPRVAGDAGGIDTELTWVPKLAPLLPLEVQTPLVRGEPEEGYPAYWSVWRWVEGEVATLDRIRDARAAAVTLGRFVAALQRIDSTGGPAHGAHNGWRGGPLGKLDDSVRKALGQLDGKIDTAKATAAWEESLGAPNWQGPPVWVHGDLLGANLLEREGALTGVIDFGCLGVGDPGCDAGAAWMSLPAQVRDAFRSELNMDDDAWIRGRGWALFVGLVGLPYYEHSNPVFAAFARRTIEAVLADFDPR